ncbi:MAG: hypothetical protein A2X86_12420 [Bdellovibrionales bacterium GWA2_49_15]|nr:MAG: hypothetical protein A2X86_12420 [Bdellovibrionales bacterium GWA2_49_15]
MYNKKKILGIIPARSGSKGLPQKNILSCGGKPLIQWSIEAGLNSKFIDRVVVSTDSESIAEVATKCKGDVPFLRSPELATDSAATEAVIHEMIEKLAQQKHLFDYIMLLQPTSPLRTSQHIDQAIEQYFRNLKSEDETLVSVYQAPAKVGWLMEENAQKCISFCFDQKTIARQRQGLKKYYLPNGAIYFAPIKTFGNSFYTARTQYFVMLEEDSIDIDLKQDLEKASLLLSHS